MTKILVTGAQGQIGSDLLHVLAGLHGPENIVATDIQPPAGHAAGVHEEILDVRDAARLGALVAAHGVTDVYHLASLLSATGEKDPQLCWEVNMEGLRHVLELAREKGLRVFWPSSIAAFGPRTPRDPAPQHTVLDPTTMYGVTKVAGELLCRYYAEAFGVDVRSVRFPGIISHAAEAGGGTTDYAVEIFYAALRSGSYTCFVSAETRLPMMYMPDAVRSIVELMAAAPERIGVRTSYNLGALSFTAAELAGEIARHVEGFEVRYDPDFRQQIADSWPAAVDDSAARRDWGWRHAYDLPRLVADMIENLSARLGAGRLSSTHS
jgi:nucleoside-diphosphate-sugar epimerase